MSPPAYADLHAHTHCSDGTLAPGALVQQAAACGVAVLAVTDHDTVAGVEAAQAEAAGRDLQLVTGVELSVAVEGRGLHLLGYGFDPGHPALAQYLSAFTERRRDRFDQMVERLSEVGVTVPKDIVRRHVAESAAPGRPHLARALVEAGHVDRSPEAFAQYLGREQPGYVPGPTQPAVDAIETLHAAGGVAVLAHPGQWTPSAALTTLRQHGLDGIECVCPSHPDYLEQHYRRTCRAHDLLVTGGTDYHGSPARSRRPGDTGLTHAQWERFRASVL
jgi:predicted metal-dependent phosphoesterase TrpH